MKDSVLEADLAYAVKIVKNNFATIEQAARTCGVDPADLRARLRRTEAPCAILQKKFFESFDR